MVNQTEFWTLVETVGAASGGDEDHFSALLCLHLATLPQTDWPEYQRVVQDLLRQISDIRVDGEPLHRAVANAWGGCSDDSFSDLRSSVIANGREYFRRVLASPMRTLAETPPRFGLSFEGAMTYPLHRLEAHSGVDARRGLAFLESLETQGDDARSQMTQLLVRGPDWLAEGACLWLMRDLRARVDAETQGWPDLFAEGGSQPHGSEFLDALTALDGDAARAALTKLECLPPATWIGGAADALRRQLQGLRFRQIRRVAELLGQLESWAVAPFIVPLADCGIREKRPASTLLYMLESRPVELALLTRHLASHRDPRWLGPLGNVRGHDASLVYLMRAARMVGPSSRGALGVLARQHHPQGQIACLLDSATAPPDDAAPMLEIVAGTNRLFEKNVTVEERPRAWHKAALILWKSELEGTHDALRQAFGSQPDVRSDAAVFLGLLGDDVGAEILVARCATPPQGELTLNDQLFLRSLVQLGPRVRGADLSGWTQQSELLQIARVAIGQGEETQLRAQLHASFEAAIHAADQYAEGMIDLDEALAPVTLLSLSVRAIGDDTARSTILNALSTAMTDDRAYLLESLQRELST